jgi:hypothetical protein
LNLNFELNLSLSGVEWRPRVQISKRQIGPPVTEKLHDPNLGRARMMMMMMMMVMMMMMMTTDLSLPRCVHQHRLMLPGRHHRIDS